MTTFIENLNILKNRSVWIIKIKNDFSKNNSLLISKVSEAIMPNKSGNNIGEGATLDKIILCQPNIKFIINGGFNHYRKKFYKWSHQNYSEGDPVGIVKIREHFYNDVNSNLKYYGFFVQKNKLSSWNFVDYNTLVENDYKYIMGCTPMLIHNYKKCILPIDEMNYKDYEINPPSLLYHGNESRQRTAVGIKNGYIYFIVVDENDEFGGCSLMELQSIGLNLKLENMLNLDGGGSSQFKIKSNKEWITNNISDKDKERILGNLFILFNKN